MSAETRFAMKAGPEEHSIGKTQLNWTNLRFFFFFLGPKNILESFFKTTSLDDFFLGP